MKVKFCIATFIVISLFIPRNVWAADNTLTSGTELLRQCQAGERIIDDRRYIATQQDAIGAGYCIGMVMGISSSQNTYSDSLPIRHEYKVCLPDGTTTEQNLRVVLKYLRNHPEELHRPGFDLIFKAFLEAYRCK